MKEAGIDKLKLELMVSNSPVDMQLGQVIQSMAAEAGFDVQLKASEFASQLRDQQQGKFQLSRVGWSGRIDPDGNIHAFIHSKGGLNDGKYNNAKVDEMLDKARTIYDQAARKQLYDDVQKISDDEAAIIYLYNQPWYFAMRANLQNFAISHDKLQSPNTRSDRAMSNISPMTVYRNRAADRKVPRELHDAAGAGPRAGSRIVQYGPDDFVEG